MERGRRDGGVERPAKEKETGRRKEVLSERLSGVSLHTSSREKLHFAEEGSRTIKQRPRTGPDCRGEAVLQPQASPEDPKTGPGWKAPEFNLKESDTVKRRHKTRDKDTHTPDETDAHGDDTHTHTLGRANGFHTHANGECVSEEGVRHQRRGLMRTSLRSSLSSKPHTPDGRTTTTTTTSTSWPPPASQQTPPPRPAPGPAERAGPPQGSWSPGPHHPGAEGGSGLYHLTSSPASGLSSGVSVNKHQSVASTSPAPAHPYPHTEPPGQAGRAGKAQAGGACSEVLVQRRLDETSTSLEAALKVVEKKLAQDDCGSSTVKAAGNILDDIGNMFDDLADQLDAMLE